jgi:DNA-binding response OmpR family regulator
MHEHRPVGEDGREQAADRRAWGRRKALVIEDAADIGLLLCEALRRAGFDAAIAHTGAEGLEMAVDLQPDLVTLDLTLPDLDGIEVCRRLRTRTNAYVIMLTARAQEADRLLGLEMGADDYMVKPFSPRELRARVGAMFRRPRLPDPDAADDESPSTLRFGDLVVDRESHEVALAGRAIVLTAIEFDLLVHFMAKPRRVWDRATLQRQVWDTDWPGDDHVVDVHIANLRRKLGDNAREGRWILTVRGVGYRLGQAGR